MHLAYTTLHTQRVLTTIPHYTLAPQLKVKTLTNFRQFFKLAASELHTTIRHICKYQFCRVLCRFFGSYVVSRRIAYIVQVQDVLLNVLSVTTPS